MKHVGTSGLRRVAASLLIVSHLCLSSGCATLAHHSLESGQRVRSTERCDGSTDVCRWLAGDAGLLLLGIVPGVIAFIVDFGTGAWRHTDTEQVTTTPDKVTSAHLLFSPASTPTVNRGPRVSHKGLPRGN